MVRIVGVERMTLRWLQRGAASVMILACVVPSPAPAQGVGTLSGRVTYSRNGDGVPGAQLLLPDLSRAVSSDDDGRYRIDNVRAGTHDFLVLLMECQLAFRSVDVPADDDLVVDFIVGPPVMRLDELVVTGVTVGLLPEVELPFTVDRVGADELRPATARSVAHLIQGRVAGVRVVQGTGQPGEAPSIILRGATSIQRSSQAPLIVIDGMVSGAGLSDIDPMDVEKIEILKGATAAALYGSRAETGVVEITTKRGLGSISSPQGPLVVLDGVVSDKALSDVDPADIADIWFLQGSAGAVIYGPRAESGAIQVTTWRGTPSDSSSLLAPACVQTSR